LFGGFVDFGFICGGICLFGVFWVVDYNSVVILFGFWFDSFMVAYFV